MAEVTVKQLAQVVGTPVEKLLVQLKDAGIEKSGESDMISDAEKLSLLTHLRQSRGEATGGGAASGKKITLRRKRVNQLKTDASGRNKVNVEVRGRRTIVKRDAEVAPEAEETADEVAADASEAVNNEAVVTEAPATGATATDAAETTGEATTTDTTAAEAAAADAVAAEVARVAAEGGAPAEVEATPEPVVEEPAVPSASDRIRAQAEEQARAAAERQAEKQVAAERRRETEETQKRDSEMREQARLQEEAQRRAAMEAQQAASGGAEGNARPSRKDSKSRKGRGASGGAGGGDTRYGRNQLHVAKGKSGRRKGKPRRALPSNIESKHGFERPTAPVVRDVEVPECRTCK